MHQKNLKVFVNYILQQDKLVDINSGSYSSEAIIILFFVGWRVSKIVWK